jgi:hypothetical protein
MKIKFKILLCAGIILTAAAFIIPTKSNPYSVPESDFVSASNSAERVNYFALHGWDVEEIDCKSVTIPTDFSTAYEEYACLQDKQGMPLREYAGKAAQLYVYQVKNYSPESKNLLAELLVCDDTAVASMVYSDDGGELKMAVG